MSYLKNLLGENEQIIFVTRQHWLVLLGQILAKGVLALGLVIVVTLIWRIWLPQSLLVPVAYLLLLLPLAGLLRNVIIWTSRQYIVTDWRVIQISGVFSKEVTDSSLEKVNDVKLEQSFVGRLLDYGDLEILTASELGVNRFTYVGQPVRLKTAMLNAKEKLEHGQTELRSRSQVDIAGPIEQLDDLREQGLLTDEEFQQQKAQVLAKL
jgi:uncharacterized membrane protein YdbT with pleckstrin-like domain